MELRSHVAAEVTSEVTGTVFTTAEKTSGRK